MKKVLPFIALCFIINACSVGTQKDFSTGFSISYKGFRVGEFGLVVDGVQVKTNEIELGKKINIEVDNIEGYKLKDGRAFPGLDLRVTDKDGNVVLNGADILANPAGFEPDKAAVLSGTITVGDPMKSGQTYHAYMKIWDKQKPENEITVEGDIVVK